jgi:septal ring factor EnvC (AmiA/AmiB activator)
MTVDSRFYIFLSCIFLSSVAFAQKTKAQLQKEKQESLNKIKETERILAETGQQKKNSLGELTALNHRISQQQELINAIRTEVRFLEDDISENQQIVEALEKDLVKLKEEYAAMMFSAQKASGKIDRLMFIFSSTSFDQLLMRLKYMEQYGTARKDQAEAIRRVQDILTDQIHQTEVIREEKNSLLKDELKEKDQLATLKQKQNSLVKSLEREEKKLRNNLEDSRKAVAKLDKLINEIIREEMARAAREAKSKSPTTNAVSLSANFEGNKSNFPWPTSGFVAQKFGRQNHPVLKGIVLQNDGINIQTKQNEVVHCIFDGEVRVVAFIPALGSSVIVSHGEYFTVYSGLKDVYVKKGDKLKTSQDIGQVIVNADGISELRFQIRKNTQALDPQQWLRN